MAYVQVERGVATWLPMVASDTTTGSPRTGITYDQVSVAYKKSSQSTFTSKTLDSNSFRENGVGVYEILFSSAELNTLGTFLFVVNGNGGLPAPTIKQMVGQAFVVDSSAYVPATITLPTCTLTGNLVDSVGSPIYAASVSCRIVSMPQILGVAPNIGGVDSDLRTVKTDAGGFFALEVLQGAVVDITIPKINYRRTLTVPESDAESLFTLP